MYLKAFPDSKFEIEQILIDGDWVCELWVADGHHNGELLGYQPTGNYTKARACNVMRVGEDGLIAEEIN